MITVMTKNKLITMVGLAVCCSLLSCGNKNKNTVTIPDTTITLEIKNSDYNEAENEINWHATNKNIVVLFGYDYNDEEFVKKATNRLSEKFGLKADGGVIIPVTFPDGFRHKEKAVTVDLFNILDDDSIQVEGFVSLGAPEKTYRALTRLQEKWNGQIPFPVISIFPQDDILGIEDTSSIVINQIQKAETEDNLVTESEQTDINDADQILENVCEYILRLSGSPERDAALAAHIKQMLPGKKIHRYTDSETGLYSINHFVIE